MALDPISGIAEVVTKILGFIPNPEERAKAEAQIQQYQLELYKAQAATNTEEAKSGSMFVAGWRPFIGWSCGFAFIFDTICLPIYATVAHAYGWPPAPPIDTSVMIMVLGGMLGIGGLRTYEKSQGIADTIIKSIFKGR